MNIITDTEHIDHERSPSPYLSDTPVSTCFSPDSRSFSGMSTLSSQSSYSNISAASKAPSSTTSVSKRRGYARPQGAMFAPSAKSRDSVMCLGSIAHLQYYFARTGLLDGKGGHLARKKENGEYDIPKKSQLKSSRTFASAVEEEGELLWEAAQEYGEDVMLPPTVSTYSHRSQYVPPPPDQQTLKRELVEALENALQALEACEKATREEPEPTQAFFELQGIEILDKTTLAIRAARLYYTMHTNPKRLHSIRSDQQIRKELYDVMEVLKKGAARRFAGGLREDERLAILIWVSEIGIVIDRENKLEEADNKEKQNWLWLQDSRWCGNEQGRTINFIDFLAKEAEIPASENYSSMGNSFFGTLTDGKKLIRLHNVAVNHSKKPFGQIEKRHEDTSKPYRRAENVRYWLKAAELRFELKLKLNVLPTVNITAESDPDSEAWIGFQQAVLEWASVVRGELVRDWNGDEERKLHARARSLAMASPICSPATSPARSPSKKKRSPLAIEEEDENDPSITNS